MAIWLIRAGSHGEYEQKFIQENRVYVTWSGLDVDLSGLTDRSDLKTIMAEKYPDRKINAIKNWASQVWPFAHEINRGDIVVLPLKAQRAILIGEIAGDYQFAKAGPDPYFHWRSVKWISEPIPRSHFGQDLLNTFGAFMTICRVQQNNAESRLQEMRKNNWRPETNAAIIGAVSSVASDEISDAQEDSDIEESARDQIVRLIEARFKGHGLTRLIEAILKAQGYTTYRSPEGADGGADILAGTGPLGFGSPRLCVEVKSESSPIDSPSINKLIGAVATFGAEQGLFVSWSGYRRGVTKTFASSFFRVRLWTQVDVLEQLFAQYDKLDEEIKAELPLKRIWTVAAQDD